MTTSIATFTNVAMAQDSGPLDEKQRALHWSDASEWVTAPRQERSQKALTAILRAASDLFECDGFAATTIAAIADRAEVSVASIYRRFPDKAAIFRAIVELWSRSWDEDFDRIWSKLEARSYSQREIVEFHADVVFSAWRSAPGLLTEIVRLSATDDRVAAILARMDAHASNDLRNRLQRAGATDEVLSKVHMAHWLLTASLSALLARTQRGIWPPFSIFNPVLEADLRDLVLNILKIQK